MSRAYLECNHYNVIYSEDEISLGDRQFCDDCRVYRQVTRLPDSEAVIGKSVVITNAELLDFLEEDDAIHGVVIAPDPRWIDKYIVSMKNGDIRYLYREDFQLES